MGVLRAPSGDEGFTHIGAIIPVGILEPLHPAAVHHDHTPSIKNKTRRNAQLVGKDDGSVQLAIAVGVFQNLESVASLSFGLKLVGVVHRLGDPQPASMVEGKPKGFDDVRFGGKEINVKSRKGDQVLLRSLRGQRFLHPADGVSLGSPSSPGGVVGKTVRGFHVFESWQTRVGLQIGLGVIGPV